MSYIINTTSGNVYATVQDGTINTTSGINLIGRNYTSYGDAQNENFIKLLENFANNIPPSPSIATIPLTGTLWYDTGNNILKVYDGTNWYPVSQRTVSTIAPTVDNIGDQWYDTTNAQLKTWTGSSWEVIGPSYTVAQGITGTVPGTIVDNNNISHTVANTYTGGNLISITSYDTTFTPNVSIFGFSSIQPGINLLNNVLLNGTAINSQTVGGINPSVFARTDLTPTFTRDLSVAGNIVLGYANIHFASNNNLILHNHAYNGNVVVYTNSSLGNVKVLNFDGNTGLGTVYGDPTSNTGIATKQYVDNNIASLNADFTNLQNEFNTSIGQSTINTNANLNSVNSAINALISTQTNLINSNVATLTSNTLASFTYANANAAGLFNSISNISNVLPLLATFKSPVFTGNPQVPVTQAQLAYQTTLNGLQSYYQMSGFTTVNYGDYLVQVDPTSYAILSNVRSISANASSISNLIVQIITGTISTLANTITFRNNTLVPVHVTSTGKAGPTPVFLGLGDSSSSAATTAYVDLTANLLYGDYTNKIGIEATTRASAIANAIAPLADIASPVFTGNPTAPTPSLGNNSTTIATTAFVTGAIESQKFNYTVSNLPPSGGNNGDFWFQTGS
jgi:hypothetical protein